MTRTQGLAYGLLALPLAFAALPVYVHVPRFYASETGLALGWLGGLLLLVRLADALIDPWLGRLADRYSRRKMLLIALLPLSLGVLALFDPPVVGAAPWLVLALLLTYLGFSAATIAYQALGAAAASDPASRTSMTASREGFGLLGILLAAALPGLLAADANEGLQYLSWLMPPLLMLAAWLSLRAVNSDTQPEITSSSPAAGGDWQRLLADPSFRRLLTVFVWNGIAAAVPATLFLFFVADVLAAESAGGGLLALYFLSGAVSLPLWVRLAAKLGRPQAWAWAMMLAMVAFSLTLSIGPGDLSRFALVCLLSGLALGADLALPAALAADIGERLRCSGSVFGLWNFVSKLNLALAAGLALPALAWLGYEPGSDTGLTSLSLAYACLPLCFKALALIFLLRGRAILEK